MGVTLTIFTWTAGFYGEYFWIYVGHALVHRFISAWEWDVCCCVPIFMTAIPRYISSNTFVRIMTRSSIDYQRFLFRPISVDQVRTIFIVHFIQIVSNIKIDIRKEARNCTRQYQGGSSSEKTFVFSTVFSGRSMFAVFDHRISVGYSCNEGTKLIFTTYWHNGGGGGGRRCHCRVYQMCENRPQKSTKRGFNGMPTLTGHTGQLHPNEGWLSCFIVYIPKEGLFSIWLRTLMS